MEYLIWGIIELVAALFWGASGPDSNMKTGGGRLIRTPAAAISHRGPCAYCKKTGGLFVTCRDCRTPHHRDCARLNGRCAVYGCRNRKFLVPAA